jgi:hypothetical protein
MDFSSSLFPREVVIDEFTPSDHAAVATPANMSKGREARDWKIVGHCALRGARALPATINRSLWTPMIQSMEASKSRVSDLIIQGGLESLDQNGTNYCWTNGVVTCIESNRCANGLPYLKLSPASVAAPIKGYRNQGGWGGEALEYIVAHGICTTDLWPANAISRSYFDNSRANASLHKVTEWYDLNSRNFDQLMTCLLLRIPVAIGLNWWSHEVAAIDPVVVSPGRYGVRIRNSWGPSYGDNGFAILTESKATPDDACAPIVSMAATK